MGGWELVAGVWSGGPSCGTEQLILWDVMPALGIELLNVQMVSDEGRRGSWHLQATCDTTGMCAERG